MKKGHYAMAVHSTATGRRQMIRITLKNVTWIRMEAYAIQRSHALEGIEIHTRKGRKMHERTIKAEYCFIAK